MRRVLQVLVVVGCLLGVLAMTTGPVPRTALDGFTFVANALAERLGAGRLAEEDAEGLANVVLFVPLGAVGALLLRRHAGWVVIALGALSLTIEVLQARLPDREPSYRDVVMNSAGAVAGALTVLALGACWSWLRRASRRGSGGPAPAG
jgi:VanZ family protein